MTWRPPPALLARRGRHLLLPLAGRRLWRAIVDPRFALELERPREGWLHIDGDIELRDASGALLLAGATSDRAVRLSLADVAGATVREARAARHGDLILDLQDGRVLWVADGPFEAWRFVDADGLTVIGGVGQVSAWAGSR
ncbi:MAG: hypothetical protein H6742_08725 [Alphaproteobacteria bacterium]|nr:hypothetical protein [Alphaproteobacteria bacterium]